MNWPKILLISVTYEGKDYCFRDFHLQLKNLTYPNLSILFCDNSNDASYFNKLNNLQGIKAIRINPKGKEIGKVIAESYEACRQYAIRNDFDYMFCLESDIFIKTNSIIEELLLPKKPVISAIYPIGHGNESYFLLQRNVGEIEKEIIIQDLKDSKDTMYIDGTTKEIFACGLGCTLIHKNVFLQIPFRFVPLQNYFSDTYFYIDLFLMGIKNFCNTNLICEHRNVIWEKDMALNIR